MHPKNQINHSGFTLIELIVTIAILAILAALVVPALKGSYAQSLSAKCASNMGQLGKACLLYAQDNEGCLPKSSCDDPSNPSDCWTNSLQPYAGKTLLFRCPADEAQTRSRTYVINDYLTQMPCDAVTGTMNQNRLVCVEKPSQTVFLMELSKKYGATVPPDHLHLAQYYGSDIPLGDFQSQVGVERHLGKANYLFLDGHVESISWKDAQTMINQNGSRFINPLPTE